MKVGRWSTTAANNNSTPPDGWPEGQAPSTVNDCARELMAAVRTVWQDAQFFDQDFTPTFVNATSFTVTGDQTSAIHAGRRLKLFDATAGVGTVIYATVVTASFTAVTTIQVANDGAANLTSSLSSFAIAIINSQSLPNLLDLDRISASAVETTTLTVSGAAVIKDTLSVSGNAVISGNATVFGALGAGATLTVSGATVLGGTLSVSGAAVMKAGLSVEGALAAGTSLSVSGATALKGVLSVGGTTTLGSTLTASGAVVMNSTLSLSGACTMNSTLTVSGTASFLRGVSISGGLAVGGVLSLSSVITFQPSPNVSAGANTLDNYEEGTFTPSVLISATAPATLTYNVQAASYTRIGNRCLYNINITLTNKGAIAGPVTIDGLPFASQNTPNDLHTAAVLFSAMTNMAQVCFARVNQGLTTISLFQISGNNAVALQDTNLLNNSIIQFTGHYRTAT